MDNTSNSNIKENIFSMLIQLIPLLDNNELERLYAFEQGMLIVKNNKEKKKEVV